MKRVAIVFSLLGGVAFFGSAQAAAPNGLYDFTGTGSCITSVAGFNADDSAIIQSGSLIVWTTITYFGTTSFDAAKGTATTNLTELMLHQYNTPGSPTTFGFASNKTSAKIKAKFTTGVDASGQTTLTWTPAKTGGVTGQVIAGYDTGATFSIDNSQKGKGVVSPSGEILLTSDGPTVAVQTYNGGLSYLLCNFTSTMLPVPS